MVIITFRFSFLFVVFAEPHESSPPQFSERSLKIDAKKDELVILPCFSQGYPPPEYR